MTSSEILSSPNMTKRAESTRRLVFSPKVLWIIPFPRLVRFYSIEIPTKIGADVLYQGYHPNSRAALRAARRELGGNTNGS